MDIIGKIPIIDISNKNIPLREYGGGIYFYEIASYLNSEGRGVDEKSVEQLIGYFPPKIDEWDLKELILKSPIFTLSAKKMFFEAENERQSNKERRGNAICRKCKSEAQTIFIQTRGGDEATTVKTICGSCNAVYTE